MLHFLSHHFECIIHNNEFFTRILMIHYNSSDLDEFICADLL